MKITTRENQFSTDYGYYKGSEFVFHNENGPAVVYVNGDVCWYIHGRAHREDGPAIDWEAYKAWYINGVYHREDGPAIENKNNNKFYIEGKEIREGDFKEAVNIYRLSKLCK
jgi:hypothetical protein